MKLNRREILKAFELYEPCYTVFPLSKTKRNGQKKVRWISAPNSVLKKIQQMILQNVLYSFSAHPCAHAYVAHKNIRSNANEHRQYEYTIVLDLKDFFPSITSELLYKTLSHYKKKFKNDVHQRDRTLFCWDEKSRDFVLEKLDEQDSLDLLLTLCTENGVLPQGAPTSGALSNIVMYPLDCLFEQVAVDKDFVYTRYADDLAFSGNNIEELKHFVFGYVFRKVKEVGFQINTKKIHIFQGDQKLITGLNVHPEGTRPSRKYRRLFRAKLANLRRDILKTSDWDSLFNKMVEVGFLRSHFGNLWYQMYTESYSDEVENLAKKYFSPIREHLELFFPGFNESPTKFKTHFRSFKIGSFNKKRLSSMQAEFYKLFNTGVDSTNPISLKSASLSSTSTPINFASIITVFSNILSMSFVSYREKRNLITRALDSLETKSLKKVYFTVKIFQGIYRLASPEDKIRLLLLAAKVDNSFTLWHKIISYACRLGYRERLAVTRLFAEDSAFVKPKSVLAEAKWNQLAEQLLRSLMLKDLTEFITSDNVLFRSAAKKHIVLKNTIHKAKQ